MWNNEWNGHVKHQTWDLSSPISCNSFFGIVQKFYDANKTEFIWKSGLIGRDLSCSYCVKFNHSKILLTVRVLNIKKQFNVDILKCDSYLVWSEKIFMEISLFLEFLLVKNNVAYLVRYF